MPAPERISIALVTKYTASCSNSDAQKLVKAFNDYLQKDFGPLWPSLTMPTVFHLKNDEALDSHPNWWPAYICDMSIEDMTTAGPGFQGEGGHHSDFRAVNAYDVMFGPVFIFAGLKLGAAFTLPPNVRRPSDIATNNRPYMFARTNYLPDPPFTGNTTQGSNVITGLSTSAYDGPTIGNLSDLNTWAITGPGIPAGSKIVSSNAPGEITLNNAATATATGATLGVTFTSSIFGDVSRVIIHEICECLGNPHDMRQQRAPSRLFGGVSIDLISGAPTVDGAAFYNISATHEAADPTNSDIFRVNVGGQDVTLEDTPSEAYFNHDYANALLTQGFPKLPWYNIPSPPPSSAQWSVKGNLSGPYTFSSATPEGSYLNTFTDESTTLGDVIDPNDLSFPTFGYKAPIYSFFWSGPQPTTPIAPTAVGPGQARVAKDFLGTFTGNDLGLGSGVLLPGGLGGNGAKRPGYVADTSPVDPELLATKQAALLAAKAALAPKFAAVKAAAPGAARDAAMAALRVEMQKYEDLLTPGNS